MNKGAKILLGVFFMISILCMPSFLLAESEIGLYGNDIDTQIWPETPEPYKDVTIKLTSYATDLSKAIIEWRVGTKILLSGYGKTSYSLVAPGPDSSISINVTITPSESIDKITKTITIRASDMSLLYEAIGGSVPPFYKGKTLLTKGEFIKVVAIPNTNTIKSGKGNISYMWKNGENTDTDSSGYNKDSYIFKNDDLNKIENITVAASSVDGLYNSTKSIDISTYNPKMIFYKKSPTEGTLYNMALDDQTLFSGDEMTIVAEPYFLKTDFGKINYSWKINGNEISTPSKQTELTVKPTASGGYATIGLTMINTEELFQKVTGLLKLNL